MTSRLASSFAPAAETADETPKPAGEDAALSGGAVPAITPAWFLYLIRCRNGSLYTGITTDVPRRFAEHQAGGRKTARYLRGKGPLSLVYQLALPDRATATRLELRVKRLGRRDKDRILAGTLDARTLL